eukprot:gene6937-11100_t
MKRKNQEENETTNKKLKIPVEENDEEDIEEVYFSEEFSDEEEEDTPEFKKVIDEYSEWIKKKELELGKSYCSLDHLKKKKKEITLQDLQAVGHIFLENSVFDELEKLGKKLFKQLGIDEDDSFFMSNSSTSYEYFDFFSKNLGSKKEFKSIKEEFSRVFSMTFLFKNNTEWYRDTDVPEECEKILNELGGRWLKLLSHGETKCGYTGENADQNIIDWLNEMKSEVEEFLPDLEIDTWVESEGETEEEDSDDEE